MSRSLSNATLTERMLDRLRSALMCNSDPDKVTFAQARTDAESLRRISMTLRRWHELECGIDGGCIERGALVRRKIATPMGPAITETFESNENGAPYWANHNGDRTTYHKMPDRETGALKRLAKIM